MVEESRRRVRVTVQLLGFLALVPLLAGVECGGIGDDDVTPDDDDFDDDDVADDDDTPADDDSTETDWEDVFEDADPEGDSLHPGADVMRYQFRRDGGDLALRMWSWVPFDDDDPDLTVRMYLRDEERAYCLVHDNVSPVPGPTQLWTTTDELAIWTHLDAPSSLVMDVDTAYSLAVGVNLSDTELRGCRLRGGVEVVDASGAGDAAPDTLWTSGHWADFQLTDVLLLSLDGIAVDDAIGGDGDGILEPGETVGLTPTIHNDGCGPDTGPLLTGELVLSPGSTAAVELVDSGAWFDGGNPLVMGDVVSSDTPFTFSIDPSASAGQVLELTLSLMDDDGPIQDLVLPPLRVEYPAQIPTTDLLSDADDVGGAFDISGVSYAVTWTELQVRVSSHGSHGGDQEVDVLLDVDQDGIPDHLLSTYDAVTGGFTGAHYRAEDGAWVRGEALATLDFAPGSNHAAFGVELAQIDRPTFALLHAVAVDPAGIELDHAPDDPDDRDALGLVDCVAQPWLALTGTEWAEVSGDGDPWVDPGETWALRVLVHNRGNVPATGVNGGLSTSSSDLVADESVFSLGDLASGDSTWSADLLVSAEPAASTTHSHGLELVLGSGSLSWTESLTVSLGERPADGAGEAPLVTESTALVGDGRDFTDDWRDSITCTGSEAAGSDAVVALPLQAGQSLTANVVYAPGVQDAVLYLSDDPLEPAGACLAGVDDRTDEEETLFFSAPAEGTYYLVVDGIHEGHGGPFVLTLSL